MAILTRTAGQTLSLSEVRAFFDGKYDPVATGLDGRSLSHYLRDGGIVLSVSDGGGGGDATAEQFTVTANSVITNPTTQAATQVYQDTDTHARLARGSDGADGDNNSARGTWGVYPSGSNYNNNITGVNIETTALTVNSSVDLLFHREQEDGTNRQATFLTFQTGDTMRIQRNAGSSTFAGNGYVFTLHRTLKLGITMGMDGT